MIFTTVSGSRYQVDGLRVRRTGVGASKRGDGEWLNLIWPPLIEVGSPAVLHLESLHARGPDDLGTENPHPTITTRTTSTVTEVTE